MDLAALQARIAEGESLTLEFKGEERVALNDRDLVEGAPQRAAGIAAG